MYGDSAAKKKRMQERHEDRFGLRGNLNCPTRWRKLISEEKVKAGFERLYEVRRCKLLGG